MEDKHYCKYCREDCDCGEFCYDTCKSCENCTIARDKYRDDYPVLIGDEWESAMAFMGHNVTSHINENGPCPECDII